ncbi:MAG: EAL domain-containing protein [Rhodospirillales bacterium]
MSELALEQAGDAMGGANSGNAAKQPKPAAKSRAQGKTDRERFVALAFCRADLLLELDGNYDIVFTAGVTPVLGVTPEKLQGSSFLNFVGDEHKAYVRDLLGGGGRNGRLEDVVLDLQSTTGKRVPVVFSGYRMPDFDDHYFLALKVEPVRKTHVAPEDLIEDEWSGVLERESFTRAAVERIQDYDRTGAKGQVTFVRLDNVQSLTETLGASEKRDLMSAVGNILKSHSLGGSTAGQLDAQNFAYVHGADVDPEDVNLKVEEVAQQLLGEKATDLGARSSTLDADGAGLSEDQVARALVHTMQEFCTGKAKVPVEKLSDALDEMMQDTVETVKYIKDTTERCDFDLVFMPICDLRLGRVHHFEALSRFRDQARAKTTFQIITLAEQLGLIVDFDFAVVRQVMDILGHMSKRGTLPPVAVNLSSLSLAEPQFVERLIGILETRQDMNRKVMFELTESAEADDLESLNKVIQEIRSRGFQFCLDDFGAGSASFDYLNALDVDVVKFDGPVVRRACASDKGRDMLSSMAKMCSSAGVHTVAEMVEDQEAANKLFYCGIDYGQGWHFGKPNPDPFAFADRFIGAE